MVCGHHGPRLTVTQLVDLAKVVGSMVAVLPDKEDVKEENGKKDAMRYVMRLKERKS